MKTAIKCVKKGKCFPRRLSEMLQRERGRGERCVGASSAGANSPLLVQKMWIGRGSQCSRDSGHRDIITAWSPWSQDIF